MDVDPDRVLSALAEVERRSGDLRPVFSDIGQQMVEDVRTHINSGVDWRGQKFAPNSKATLRRKRGNKPLIDQGDMISHRLHYYAGASELIIGSSAIQSAVLQFGAGKGAFGRTVSGRPIPFGDIPPRRFMPISPEGNRLESSAEDRIIEVISDYVDEAF